MAIEDWLRLFTPPSYKFYKDKNNGIEIIEIVQPGFQPSTKVIMNEQKRTSRAVIDSTNSNADRLLDCSKDSI